MNWIQYQIAFKLKSPLHVGYRKVGNLMQTRPYVHGKILWAALTSRLTRDYDNGASDQAYRKIGDEIHGHFRFSYLWPALPYKRIAKVNHWNDLETYFSFEIEDTSDINKLYPNPVKMKSVLFDYNFLDSRAGTAQDQFGFGSEEGSLHDIEFIAPNARKSGLPVYLTGTLWVDADLPNSLINWEKCLENVRFGGEQSYGMGRVELIYHKPLETVSKNPDSLFWINSVPAHVNTKNNTNHIQGAIEPMVGWETQQNGKKEIGPATIAFVPGCCINDTNELTIGKYGIWEVSESK
jgi:hypothetical protein